MGSRGRGVRCGLRPLRGAGRRGHAGRGDRGARRSVADAGGHQQPRAHCNGAPRAPRRARAAERRLPRRRHAAAERRRAPGSAPPSQRPTVRWRYRITLNALAVVVPAGKVEALRTVPGVARVTRSVAYGSSEASNLAAVKASLLWGADFSTAGNGVKIGNPRRRHRRVAPVLLGRRVRDAARLPARPEGVHLAEGDRGARVRAAGSDWQATRAGRTTRSARRTPCT